MKDLVPTTPVVPAFTPVPRKYRYDGWTPERQRGFIDALAETGSVKAAAHRVNMSKEGAYYLRRQPHADEFRAAWTAALDHGVTRLEDMGERALDGVAWPVFGANGQIGERRLYNDRLLMFILRHRLPDRYGPLKPLPPGTVRSERTCGARLRDRAHRDTLTREATSAPCRGQGAGEEREAAEAERIALEEDAWATIHEALRTFARLFATTRACWLAAGKALATGDREEALGANDLADRYVRAVLSDGASLFEMMMMVEQDGIAKYLSTEYELSDDFTWIDEDLKAQWDAMMGKGE